MTYVALLRGINVGGKNKIAMADLRAAFEKAGYTNVRTYITSGNVLFDSPEPPTDLAGVVPDGIGVAVMSAQELDATLAAAPAWWGQDADSKHNALFILPGMSAAEIMTAVGDVKPEYEKVAAVGQVIFWSAPQKTFSRTRYKSIVGTSTYQFVTIRNANTARKLAALCSQK